MVGGAVFGGRAGAVRLDGAGASPEPADVGEAEVVALGMPECLWAAVPVEHRKLSALRKASASILERYMPGGTVEGCLSDAEFAGNGKGFVACVRPGALEDYANARIVSPMALEFLRTVKRGA